VLRIALLLGVAELSYRYVEMPVRRGALGRAWVHLREEGLPRPSTALAVGAAALAGVVVFTGVRVLTAPAAGAVGGWDTGGAATTAVAPPLEADFERMRIAEGLDPRPRVTAFGDSVLIGASRAVQEAFRLDLNAEVGEQASEQLRTIEQQAAAGELRDTVLLHVGSNGIITEDQLRGMLTALRDVEQVLLVNVRVPRRWMEPNNALIARVAPDFPNVRVVDWAQASAKHRDWFVDDRVHLTAEGAKQYTQLLAEAAGVPVER
jgi:hypothetical protein